MQRPQTALRKAYRSRMPTERAESEGASGPITRMRTMACCVLVRSSLPAACRLPRQADTPYAKHGHAATTGMSKPIIVDWRVVVCDSYRTSYIASRATASSYVLLLVNYGA